MKAADAKAPKFDSMWWKQNKAKDADAKGAFEAALKSYQNAKKTFDKATELNDIAPLAKELDAIAKLAKTMKADPKLGVLQKETKEALVNYEKIATAALTGLTAVSRDTNLHGELQDLIKKQSKPFAEFIASEHSAENYEFLVLMSTNVKNKKVYDRYISEQAPKQVNLPVAMRRELDAVAAQGAAADWANAPWKDATAEIFRLTKNDSYKRYKPWYLQKVLSTVKVP